VPAIPPAAESTPAGCSGDWGVLGVFDNFGSFERSMLITLVAGIVTAPAARFNNTAAPAALAGSARGEYAPIDVERGISIQLKLLAAMGLVTLLAAGAFTVITLDARQNAIFREAEGKLLVAARAVREGLGPGYHDRIVDISSVSEEQFDRTVAAHNQFCRDAGLQYMWSVMVLDGRIVFTSATHSDLTDPDSDCAGFLEDHPDPQVYAQALATMRPHFTSFDNRWGRGRMLLLPEYDAHHRPVIHAASIRLADLERALAWTVVESTLISALAVAAALGLSWLLARSLSLPLVRLTEAARRMALGDLDVRLEPGGLRELSGLCASMDSMRKAIRAQLTALRQEIVVRREAEQRVRDSERHFARLAERNQRLVQEVEHRVRNNLAGLVSLVGLMRHTTGDVDAFAAAIEGRLRGMAHVQQMLVQSQWGSVQMRELVASTLNAMQPLARHQPAIAIDGPAIPLLPEQVMPLTLVLVEWFTNSCKYGAHSAPGARLRIGWKMGLQAHEPHASLTWQERDGPRIEAAAAPSLGTELVYGFVTRELRGQCWMQFPPDGADHAIEFPCGSTKPGPGTARAG
jgi:two-component sensor histidine kinase/HAMP domain-containing protein